MLVGKSTTVDDVKKKPRVDRGRVRHGAKLAAGGVAATAAIAFVAYHFYAIGAVRDESGRAQAAIEKAATQKTDRALIETLLVTGDALKWAFAEEGSDEEVDRKRVDELVRRPWVLEAGVLTAAGEVLAASNRRHEGRHLRELSAGIKLDVQTPSVTRVGDNFVLVVPLRERRIVLVYARNLAHAEIAEPAP